MAAEPVEGAEPEGYKHYYRKIGGGAKYTELNHGDANQGQEPREGFEWYASEPVYTHPAPASAQAGAVPEDLLGKLMTAKIVIANLPEVPGYNGSILEGA